jgi:hypothetical protein
MTEGVLEEEKDECCTCREGMRWTATCERLRAGSTAKSGELSEVDNKGEDDEDGDGDDDDDDDDGELNTNESPARARYVCITSG